MTYSWFIQFLGVVAIIGIAILFGNTVEELARLHIEINEEVEQHRKNREMRPK